MFCRPCTEWYPAAVGAIEPNSNNEQTSPSGPSGSSGPGAEGAREQESSDQAKLPNSSASSISLDSTNLLDTSALNTLTIPARSVAEAALFRQFSTIITLGREFNVLSEAEVKCCAELTGCGLGPSLPPRGTQLERMLRFCDTSIDFAKRVGLLDAPSSRKINDSTSLRQRFDLAREIVQTYFRSKWELKVDVDRAIEEKAVSPARASILLGALSQHEIRDAQREIRNSLQVTSEAHVCFDTALEKGIISELEHRRWSLELHDRDSSMSKARFLEEATGLVELRLIGVQMEEQLQKDRASFTWGYTAPPTL